MTAVYKVKRGRPFGTGIDDSKRLQQLAALLRSQPDLKPTAALKVLGYENPSEIRRLRDKHKLAASKAA